MKIRIEFDDGSISEIYETASFGLSNIICKNGNHIGGSTFGSFRSIPENYTRTLKNICNLISNEAEFVINNRRYEEK